MTNLNNWKKNFFTIWTGQAFSQFTSSVLQFAIIWYLTDKTESAIVLSAAMFMGFLPQGVLGPFIGVFIDRYQRKTIMIISDLCISLASLVLVVADWTGKLSTGLILLVLLVRSVGTAFHQPCLQAVTPQIVPKDQLTRCAGYSQTLQSVSEIFSPALAAVLYQHWNLGSIIFLDVIGALIAVAALFISHIPPNERPKERQKAHFIDDMKEGFQILKGNRGVLGLVFVSALFTLALMPTSALFPLMSMSYFGGTSTHASIAENCVFGWLINRFPDIKRLGRHKKQDLSHCGCLHCHEHQPDRFRLTVSGWILDICGVFLCAWNCKSFLLGNVYPYSSEQF